MKTSFPCLQDQTGPARRYRRRLQELQDASSYVSAFCPVRNIAFFLLLLFYLFYIVHFFSIGVRSQTALQYIYLRVYLCRCMCSYIYIAGLSLPPRPFPQIPIASHFDENTFVFQTQQQREFMYA